MIGDLDFPYDFSGLGRTATTDRADHIRDLMEQVLFTSPGERVMRPEFGCSMWDQLFAPLTAGTLGLIEQAVREALARWEPRIDVTSVLATGDQSTGAVHISLGYVVNSTNDVRNLVFPFYTIPTEEPAQ